MHVVSVDWWWKVGEVSAEVGGYTRQRAGDAARLAREEEV
jgi:hypothetical protein